MTKLLVTFFGLGIILTGCVTAGNPSNTTNKTPAPDFSLQNYQGQTVSLSDFKGKPLVLNSWAAWCPFCIDELPDFVTVKKEFGDKVEIVAINRREPLKTAKGFTDVLEISDELIFLIDESDSFYRSMGGFAMPETLFVDKDGNINEHYRGKLTEQQFREKVQAIL